MINWRAIVPGYSDIAAASACRALSINSLRTVPFGFENLRYRLPNTTLEGTYVNLAAAEAALEATRVATAQQMDARSL